MDKYLDTKHFMNSQGIRKINYYHTKKFFCPIGKSWCTYNFIVEFAPRVVIPDYLVIDAMIKQLPSELSIEDALLGVFNIFYYELNPIELKVTCMCEDARHSKVEVIKEL